MRYLIINNQAPFLTNYFNPENFEDGMMVVDWVKGKYTVDGENWEVLEIDGL